MRNTWNPNFLCTSQHFETVSSLEVDFTSFKKWPSLDDYNQLLAKFAVKNIHDKSLSCIPASPRPRRRRGQIKNKKYPPPPMGSRDWGDHNSAGISMSPESHLGVIPVPQIELPYEMQILHHGVIPTRLENWHDFCNMLTWCRFPRTKAVLNGLQARPHGVPRNRYQELLTLFDEGGVIRIFASKEKIGISSYPRTPAQKNLSFGHALLEADLCGFKNSDGFTIPIYLEPDVLQKHLIHGTLYQWVDDFIALHIANGYLTKLSKENPPAPI